MLDECHFTSSALNLLHWYLYMFLFSSAVTTFPDVDGHYDVSTHDWEELAQDTEDFFSRPSLTGDSSVALVYTEI